ncbi:HAD hydrolase, IA, variant 3 family protein [Paraburkholderia xenovorans LB400]|uniref:HAD-superfamily hydrolase, subfamily IA, variant3 n=1 Tax=Paraburkholderia xenovorans (strain LB400) TaxID=266265 RepID=Q13NY2_PARXL|nr:HAD-IA family hydrolase [Paraburkholderia xenovorans]ABE34207.1 HAD-superfamily hydrolase, subfamily IA, variant3 [Paraburkholderia xenovorans LB400]AIP36803.1 HAD hydrolase, IA, variant 3 family protein [Paraburkholderia xenovorans LB400]
MQPPFTLLFDLDGTLVNTDEFHFAAYQTLLADFGRSITPEIYRTRIMGAPNDAIMRELFPNEPENRHRQLADRKEELFRSAVKHLEPTRGAIDVFDWAARNDVGVAIVTNAPRQNAELMLNGLGLTECVDLLVIGDELARGKPDPLPYLTGLERLGGTARQAVAFEDSLSGIRSATGAGIYTLGISTGLPPGALRGAGAADVIDDFTAGAVWDILDRVAREGTAFGGKYE